MPNPSEISNFYEKWNKPYYSGDPFYESVHYKRGDKIVRVDRIKPNFILEEGLEFEPRGRMETAIQIGLVCTLGKLLVFPVAVYNSALLLKGVVVRTFSAYEYLRRAADEDLNGLTLKVVKDVAFLAFLHYASRYEMPVNPVVIWDVFYCLYKLKVKVLHSFKTLKPPTHVEIDKGLRSLARLGLHTFLYSASRRGYFSFSLRNIAILLALDKPIPARVLFQLGFGRYLGQKDRFFLQVFDRSGYELVAEKAPKQLASDGAGVGALAPIDSDSWPD